MFTSRVSPVARIALAAFLLAGTFGVSAAPAGATSSNVVTTCDEPTLLAALSGGGSVTFSCSGTILLTNPIVIASDQDVTIDGTGSTVTLDGGAATQLFQVAGRLQLRNLTLDHGLASAAAGAAGTAGDAGDPGVAGNGGAGGAPFQAGDAGTAGTNGTGGSSGTDGHDGGLAEGGAIGDRSRARS